MKKLVLASIAIIFIFISGLFLYEKFIDKSYLDPAQQFPNSSETTMDSNQKPRNEIITYTVQKDDTLSSVAQRFNISTDTITWANNLSSQELTIGQILQILPVSGVSHKVVAGDTIESLAKQYHTDQQKIIDFPFNSFSDPHTFSLTPGTILIIPDGSM